MTLAVGAALLLSLVLTSCGLLRTPNVPPKSLAPEVLRELNPQPPELPKPANPRPTPRYQVLPGAPRAQAELPLSDDVDRVAMKVLVLVAIVDDDPESLLYDPSHHAAAAFLDQIGMPYDVFEASTQELTPDVLVDANGDGKYSGIVLSSEGLVYEDLVNGWVSAFTAVEWDLLHQYEREFAVRQLTLNTWPGTTVEDYGLQVEAQGNPPEGYTASLTAAGQTLFPYVSSTADVPITDTWLYRASLSSGSNAVPILEGSDGRIVGVTTDSADGRERLALTYAQAPYLLHSQLFGYGLIDWVTRGVFFGQKRYHLDADVDDWFSATGRWDIATSTIIDDGYNVSDRDAFSIRAQQAAMRLAFPLAEDFTWTMAYNGERAVPSTPASCSFATPEDESPAALTAMTKCVAADFNWVNHTWSHEYMDAVPGYPGNLTFNEILDQIGLNQALEAAIDLGPGFSPLSLVTGDISGLGWYAPDGPDTGPKVDHGLEDSNPDFLIAADQLGIRYVASNMSTPSHEPDCSGCGIDHPLNLSLGTDIFLVPRYPTNVFATVTTAEEALHAYNLVYNSYWGRDLTYEEYLGKETDIALSHILSGSPYPHYFHTPNLNEYEPDRSLLTDWASALLTEYSGYMNVPLVSLRWDDFAARVEQITSHHASAPTGVWDRRAGTLTVSSLTGGTVLATGVSLGSGDDTTYAGELQSSRTLTPGGSFSVGAPTVTLPIAKLTQTITFDMALPEYRLTTDFGFELFATASSGLPVSFTGTGACFVGIDGWLYHLGTPGLCTITANQAGNATYYAAPPVSRSFQVVLPTQPLSVTIDGSGTVTGGTGGAIDCPGTCSAEFAYASEQELTATPAADSVFVGWTGAVTSATPTIQLTMTEARSVTATFSAKQSQTITFAALPDATIDQSPVALSATATSGLSVSFAADGVCTVAGTSLTLTGLGTCTVTASQAGDASYLPAPDVSRSFEVVAGTRVLDVSVVGNGSVSGGGIACPGTCSTAVTTGEDVTLTATPDANWYFQGWSGAITGTTNPASVTMDAAKTVTATFAAKLSQTITFAQALPDVLTGAEPIVLTATASSGLSVGYSASGECSVAGSTLTLSGQPGTCTVTANQPGDATYLAASPVQRSFAIASSVFGLTVDVEGSGTVSGNGISCPGTCSTSLANGSTATLSASPANGWRFSHWTGAATGSTNPVEITMSEARAVTAHFVPKQAQTITFAALADRFTTTTPFSLSASASSGLPVTFTASGVCSVAGSTVTLSGVAGTCTITAKQSGSAMYLAAPDVSRAFQVTVPTYTLTVTKAGAGIGVIVSSPGNMGCTGTCTGTFSHGTIVTLVPVPVMGSTFAGWSGACSGQGACQVSMTAARSVTAQFVKAAVP